MTQRAKHEAGRIWFTSDTHFGHRNIIRYCDRPFADAETMDRALVERWNAAVGDDDLIYHLGDFTLRGRGFARRVLAQLRGRIRVLGYPWHHDRNWLPKPGRAGDLASASGHPIEIAPPLVVRDFVVAGEARAITLCHYPLGEWDRKHHGAWHLHGHSHGTYRAEGAILDVGVDCHDYAPVALESLPELLATA